MTPSPVPPTGEFDLSLRGRHRPGIQVQFYGMFQGCTSVSNVCTQFGRALAKRFDGVALHSYNGGSFFDPVLADYAYVDNEAPVGIFYGFPSDITAAFHHHPIRIGGFVCETDRIHPSWVEICNSLHLVVVPSSFCRKAFLDSGVRSPVMVVPHGLEPEFVPLQDKRRRRPLVFYNTFSESSQLDRKGVEELVTCFLKAFGPSGEDCILKLRTELSPQLASIRLRHDFGTAILLHPLHNLSTERFARIYSEVHCTVHPSRGEGFGLVPFQSIACETPVIAPAITGMADYLDESNAMCLRTAGRIPGRRAGNQSGTYFEIDEDHLVELLLHTQAHWEDEYEKVRAAAPSFRERHSWKDALSSFIDVIESALDSHGAEGFARSVLDSEG